MEFIEEGYECLKNHLIKNGLEQEERNFNLISSMSTYKNQPNKVDVFFLGMLINREKTPRDKLYFQDKQYKVANNIFELYFAIGSDNVTILAKLFRILIDFESLEDGKKIYVLNGLKDLNEVPVFVNNFFNKSIHSTATLLKLTMSVESLVEAPEVKEIKKVVMITQKLSSIKKTKKTSQKENEVMVSYVDKEASDKLGKTKIITELHSSYEKKILKKKDKK